MLDEGWVTDEGARLLVAFRDSYYGARAGFTHTVDYELAVNGRGVPDLDIEAQGHERARLLMRRGSAFAWAALHAAGLSMPRPLLVARISTAPVLTDPDVFTGHVTFFSSHPTETVQLSGDLPDIQILLVSADCTSPLAGS
ncbi:hypothetical protein ABZ806_25170 [Spirillospora sp. NPDC047418]